MTESYNSDLLFKPKLSYEEHKYENRSFQNFSFILKELFSLNNSRRSKRIIDEELILVSIHYSLFSLLFCNSTFLFSLPLLFHFLVIYRYSSMHKWPESLKVSLRVLWEFNFLDSEMVLNQTGCVEYEQWVDSRG